MIKALVFPESWMRVDETKKRRDPGQSIIPSIC